MTVEATSFLSNTKISNGHEKSAKFLKNHRNLIIFLLAFVLLLFFILASILQIWIYNQMNKAQEEIEQLKRDVIDLKSNGLDRDLLAEIAEFNKKYHNDVKDQIDLDAKVNLVDEKVKFDDVGESTNDDLEAENSEESDEDEDNYEEYHSGYGEEYDDEYDEDTSLEDETVDQIKLEDDNNIYKDMTKHTRKTRSISEITEQGVVVHEEPYSARRNRTKASPQDSNGKHPKLRLTWNGQYRNLNSPRRDHDRNRHHIRHHHHSHNAQSGRFAFAAAPVHHAFESSGPKLNETTPDSTAIPIQNRKSRVMHFEDKTKAFRQVVGKDQLAKLKEQRIPATQFVSYPNVRRKSHPQNMSLRKNLELKNGKRMKITAVHYDGDSTKLEEMRHHSFKGNGKVELNRNEYLHWKPAEWVVSHGMDKYFSMDSTGTLTIHDHGLFMIYAQVYYSDTHDLNGYQILLNNAVHYQCTTMTHTGSLGVSKTNSCYTSGLIHLRNGDKVRLRDVGHDRSVLMQKSKSYFGLIKINLMPATHSNENTDVERFDQVK